jgi:hypothetical protein
VFVKDPSDELRLGMPATVYLSLDQGRTQTNVSDRKDSSVEKAQ